MSENKKIKVLIVDDHRMLRNGLKTFLSVSDEFELVGEAGNGESAIVECEKLRPDVVLMDLLMPGMGGLAATKQIKSNWPDVQVVVLTSSQDKKSIQTALSSGATSYILKNASPEELGDAVKGAFSHRSTLSQEVMAVLSQKSDYPDSIEGYGLTPREMEVLKLVAKGMSNPDIAEELHVSVPTISSHVSKILTKLQVTKKGEAIALVHKRDLLN